MDLTASTVSLWVSEMDGTMVTFIILSPRLALAPDMQTFQRVLCVQNNNFFTPIREEDKGMYIEKQHVIDEEINDWIYSVG